MNPERRLALLEDFARTKGADFDGFIVQWLTTHPEPAEAVEPIIYEEYPAEVAVVEKPKRKRRTETPAETELPEAEEVIEDVGSRSG